MKFKSIVASLVVTGLMSPAFGHTTLNVANQQAIIDQNSVISTVCTDGWFNRITVGGLGSIVGIWGNHDLPGKFLDNSNGSDLFVNNANLLFNVTLAKWAKFTLNLAYRGIPTPWVSSEDRQGYDSFTSSSLPYYRSSHRIFGDEIYVTFADLAKYPVYAKFGKMYVPFGEYNDQYVPWQIESPAQMLAMINAPAAVVGVSTDFGFHASLFAFRGDTSPLDAKTNNVRNWGAKIGYYNNLSAFKASNVMIDASISYVRNVWDSAWFTPNTSYPEVSGTSILRDPVGGIAAHVGFKYKAFNMYADWVGTMKNMRDAYATGAAAYASSSKFWGANINAAYEFETWSHDSSLGAGVHYSRNGDWFADNSIGKTGAFGAGGLFALVIPKWRGLVEYKINLCKFTDLSLIYAHSESYELPLASGVEDRHTNIGLARLAVRF